MTLKKPRTFKYIFTCCNQEHCPFYAELKDKTTTICNLEDLACSSNQVIAIFIQIRNNARNLLVIRRKLNKLDESASGRPEKKTNGGNPGRANTQLSLPYRAGKTLVYQTFIHLVTWISSSADRFMYRNLVLGLFQPACLSLKSGSAYLKPEYLAPPLLMLCVVKSLTSFAKGATNFLMQSKTV